jgi:hypothetical protein
MVKRAEQSEEGLAAFTHFQVTFETFEESFGSACVLSWVEIVDPTCPVPSI